MTLIRPSPRIYIDTNHLANISKLRCGRRLPDEATRPSYAFIDQCITDLHCGVIFNPAAPLEWVAGDATEQSAIELARVLDSAQVQYEIEDDSFVYLAEALLECNRVQADLHVPKIQILHERRIGSAVRRALNVLAAEVPRYFKGLTIASDLIQPDGTPTEIPFIPIEDHAKLAHSFRRDQNTTYQERVMGFNAALQDDILNSSGGRSIGQEEIERWLDEYLRVPLVLRALNPHCNTRQILAGFIVNNCPAVSLFMGVRRARVRTAQAPKDTDVGDWLFLHVVPYADLVLTDRHFREMIIQADRNLSEKVVAKPLDAERILRKWYQV